MTNILVITHGNLAKEFVDIAEKIINKKCQAIPVCFDLELDHEEYKDKINDAMASLDAEKPLIILTDLFGGTPSNLAIPFVQKQKVEVITGLNLPMLLYLLNQNGEKTFDQLCEGARQAGREAIIVTGEFLM